MGHLSIPPPKNTIATYVSTTKDVCKALCFLLRTTTRAQLREQVLKGPKGLEPELVSVTATAGRHEHLRGHEHWLPCAPRHLEQGARNVPNTAEAHVGMTLPWLGTWRIQLRFEISYEHAI